MNRDGSGTVALVTGASSGIGLALACEFANRGFDVVVAAEDALIHDAAAEIAEAFDVDATSVQVDLATREGVEELHRRTKELAMPIGAVALNAGVGVGGRFVDTELEAHLRLVALNVTHAVHLARLVLPDMVARGDGGLLFTSSIAATMPEPFQSTYAASKAFLLSFAEALRVELEDDGVVVTALMPGPTETNFFERAGIEDTRLGQMDKDDPVDVARDGVDALLAGKDKVVAGSMKNRAQAATARVVPDSLKAKVHGKLTEPGSGTG